MTRLNFINCWILQIMLTWWNWNIFASNCFLSWLNQCTGNLWDPRFYDLFSCFIQQQFLTIGLIKLYFMNVWTFVQLKKQVVRTLKRGGSWIFLRYCDCDVTISNGDITLGYITEGTLEWDLDWHLSLHMYAFFWIACEMYSEKSLKAV